jgi:hypothetical protein
MVLAKGPALWARNDQASQKRGDTFWASLTSALASTNRGRAKVIKTTHILTLILTTDAAAVGRGNRWRDFFNHARRH